MFKSTLLLFVIFTGSHFQVATSKNIKPLDLAEEAEEQLQELISIVQGDILVAHNDFDDLQMSYGSYTTNLAGEAMISLRLEEITIGEQISTIENLGISAGKDVTSCTDTVESVLNGISFKHSDAMGYCLGGNSWNAFQVVEESRYLVDVVMSKVQQIEFELRQCRGDLLCISPIVTKIELNKIELPQDIKTEMQSCQSQLDSLKLVSQTCADTMLAGFVAEANALVETVTECVNQIIG